MPPPDSAGLEEEVRSILAEQGKIAAIKSVRVRTGIGLVQAKAYVEALQSGGDPREAAASAHGVNLGCGAVVYLLVGIAVAALLAYLMYRGGFSPIGPRAR